MIRFYSIIVKNLNIDNNLNKYNIMTIKPKVKLKKHIPLKKVNKEI